MYSLRRIYRRDYVEVNAGQRRLIFPIAYTCSRQKALNDTAGTVTGIESLEHKESVAGLNGFFLRLGRTVN